MHLEHLQTRATATLMATNLVRAVGRRAVKYEQYRAYMIDVYHYAAHSSQVISLAGSRLTLSHPPLAAYLFTHAGQELGHDQWAAADLRDLGMTEDEIADSQPSDACLQMLGIEYLYAAHLNPAGLFGWMFALESLGGRVGGGIANEIDEALNLHGKGVYFLRGHAEADQQHSEDLTRVIRNHVVLSADQMTFLRVFDLSIQAYVEIIDHAAAEGRDGDLSVAREVGVIG